MAAAYTLIAVVLIVAGFLLYPRWRKRRVLAGSFPADWVVFVERALPFFHRLSSAEQKRLQDMIRLFLDHKRFYGCGGLEITDEIRVTIAAGACLLLLNRGGGIYPGLRHILVYPDAFIAEREEYHPDGTVSVGDMDMSGESWDQGKVILSWDDVEFGIEGYQDGYNVVLHEFAHQLDAETGETDGMPLLHRDHQATWTRVMSRELEALRAAVEKDEEVVLDEYGTESPAEFFAVATETFFEMPGPMKQRHPELFAVLEKYYRVDPTRWR